MGHCCKAVGVVGFSSPPALSFTSCCASQTTSSKHSFLRHALHCQAGKQLRCCVPCLRLRASFLKGLRWEQPRSGISSWPHLLAAQHLGFLFPPWRDAAGPGVPRGCCQLGWPQAPAQQDRGVTGRWWRHWPVCIAQDRVERLLGVRLKWLWFVFSCIWNSPQLLPLDSLWVLLYIKAINHLFVLFCFVHHSLISYHLSPRSLFLCSPLV